MKTVSLENAVALIPDGASIMVGGFMGVGTPERVKKMIAGEMEVELVPQGTLIERLRAAGHGLGGILTPTGVGTKVEEGKRKIEVEGATWLLETALKADFALVEAFLSDYYGTWSTP